MGKKVIKLTEQDLRRIIEAAISSSTPPNIIGPKYQIRNSAGRTLAEVTFRKTAVDFNMSLVRIYLSTNSVPLLNATYLTYDCGSKKLKKNHPKKDVLGEEVFNDGLKTAADAKFCSGGKLKTSPNVITKNDNSDTDLEQMS